jgi:hypothetical protein
MTEAEWLSSNDPLEMAASLTELASERKLRLFSCHCCRHIWRLLDESHRRLLQVAEMYADGGASVGELRSASEVAAQARDDYVNIPRDDFDIVVAFAQDAVDMAASEDKRTCCEESCNQVRATISRETLDGEDLGAAKQANCELQISLLRDIFGNPFRPTTLAAANRTATVVSLARAAYDERQLPGGDLDTHRLAVLADALEEAGAGGELVAHLRGPGPHVRGCHVVDLCLSLS